MIDHIGLRVRDLAGARELYRRALTPLGYELCYDGTDEVGFRAAGVADLWLHPASGGPCHVALRAPGREAVDAFHAAALAAGARDNGGPGLREGYPPGYYAAFVLDADGNNVEAVCRLPPDP